MFPKDLVTFPRDPGCDGAELGSCIPRGVLTVVQVMLLALDLYPHPWIRCCSASLPGHSHWDS